MTLGIVRRALTVVLVALGVGATACTMHETTCSPGDYEYCPCPGDAHGYSICANDGSGYGACDCSGKLPPEILTDAAIDAPNEGASDAAVDANEAGGGGGFGAPCKNPSDCAPGLECYPFNAKGPHCSHKCSNNTDCPTPPGLGCSGMGECKIP